MDKGGGSPMEGYGYCNPCPSPSLYKAMGGCGVDQSSLLSEPSEVKKKERKKQGRKAIGQERERKKKKERERRRKKRSAARRRDRPPGA